MIAIVTSCLYPSNEANKAKRSHFSNEEREKQTLATLTALEKFNFSKVIFVDNSKTSNLDVIKAAFGKVEVIHIKQYQFVNKGINELLMLLAILDRLPDNEAIFKISGRYLPNAQFDASIDRSYDFKVRAYDAGTSRETISTRAYFVRNKEIYHDFLLQTLNETYLYPQRIVGLRSLANLLKNTLKTSFSPSFNTSIEFAGARVLRHSTYKIQRVASMGIEGQVAGFENQALINE